jgi:uncharacterized protein (TIGR01777 family)
MKPRRIAVTGASGFVGSALVAALRDAGCTVLTIGRHAPGRRSKSIPDVEWNPRTGTLDAAALAGVEAVVHLAGSPVGRRWTSARKREIRESRVLGTRLIAQTMARLSPMPQVLIVASAIGYYGSRGDEWLDEESAPGTDFLAEVVVAWEGAADAARAAGVRVVHARTGLVLGRTGGALARLLPPFRVGLGGRLGGGRQWMSWITLADLVSALRFTLETDTVAGAVNAVSPSPVTNAEFTSTLARVLGKPVRAPVPAIALRILFGEMAAATLLASQRVRPGRLERAGFACEHPKLEEALRFELGP